MLIEERYIHKMDSEQILQKLDTKIDEGKKIEEKSDCPLETLKTRLSVGIVST